jgi:hypothetical protein
MEEVKSSGTERNIPRRTALRSVAGLAATSACSMAFPGMAGVAAAVKAINPIADKHTLEGQFRPWGEVAEYGIPIHFGELGCDKYTAPNVVNAWFSDTLDVINSLHSGWALWNFRGPFGILDTDRAGTDYKNWHGHKLDVALLHVLQAKIKT